jgi:hypothetical protein
MVIVQVPMPAYEKMFFKWLKDMNGRFVLYDEELTLLKERIKKLEDEMNDRRSTSDSTESTNSSES